MSAQAVKKLNVETEKVFSGEIQKWDPENQQFW